MLGFLDDDIPYTSLTWNDLLVSILVLAVGLVAVKLLTSYVKKGMRRTALPELVVEFLARLMAALLYVAVLLVFAASLGFDVDSAVLGMSAIIGLILGFGMQDTITNLASGVWLAAIRPMEKGEFITVAGHTGTVSAVGIMATELVTPDNQFITLPNRLVWNGAVVNFSRMPTRRAAVDVGISYRSDLEKAVSIAMEVMRQHPKVLDEPSPTVIVMNLGDSSVDLQLRAWTANADVWSVKWDLTGKIFEAFRDQGVEIPYPQRDIHIKNE